MFKRRVPLVVSNTKSIHGRVYPARILDKIVRDFYTMKAKGPVYGFVQGSNANYDIKDATHEICDVWLSTDKSKRLSRKKKKVLKEAFGSNSYVVWRSGGDVNTLFGNIRVFNKRVKSTIDFVVFRPEGTGHVCNDVVDTYDLVTFNVVANHDDCFRGIIPKS